MAKMSDVAPVTEYQLVQLASVAVAVGRAENVPLTAALRWLSRQVDDGQLSSRLYDIPSSNGVEIGVWSAAGDDRQWKLIEKKAVARQWDADKMPTIAQSRYLHVDDLAQLAASTDTSEACRAALLELVGMHQLAPSVAVVPAQSAEPVPAPAAEPKPAAVVAEAPKNDRGECVKRAALIERNRRRWVSIERDLKDASTNGLSAEARATDKPGFWWEGDALKWARARNKEEEAQAAPASLASVVHRMAR